MSRRFKSMDDDGSGSLCISEFKKALGEYSMILTGKVFILSHSRLHSKKKLKEVEAVFNHFDTDKSGRISFDEFLKGLRVTFTADLSC